MQETLIVLGIVFVVFCLCALLGITVAAVTTYRTPWARCPKCFRWHNDIGEIADREPVTGIRVQQPKTCPECE